MICSYCRADAFRKNHRNLICGKHTRASADRQTDSLCPLHTATRRPVCSETRRRRVVSKRAARSGARGQRPL
jgi:hypothetical protein